jgi:putative RecB family exonuclease
MAIYSHSQLSCFEQCPLKFRFRYIDRLEPDIKQTIEGFLGNKVHDALEWAYNEARHRIEDIELDELIHRYAESWRKDFNQRIKIVKSGYDEEFYFNKGIRFLVDYFVTHSPFKDNTIATEKKIKIDLNSDGKYLLIGYIDRLVHHKEENIFEIHDYKTGSLKTQEELDQDRQLALYSIAIRNLFANVRDVHLVWHFLDYNKKMVSKRTPNQLEQLKQDIINLINKIESTTEFNPHPSILCDWCEFRSYCPMMNN